MTSIVCETHHDVFPCAKCSLAVARQELAKLKALVEQHEKRAKNALDCLNTFERAAVTSQLCERAKLTNSEQWALTGALRLARKELLGERPAAPAVAAGGRLALVPRDDGPPRSA